MVRSAIFAIVVFAAGFAGVSASEPAAPPVDVNAPRTLEQYLQVAALQNAGLRAAFEEWRMALEQIPQAQALPDPMFTYGYFIEQVETRQQAGIMQVFPWFGTIAARTDAAAAAANAAQQRYDARKLRLFFAVKDAFYEYAYLANAIRIATENLALAEHFEEVARARFVAAAIAHADVIRAQIRVADLQDRLISLEELRGPIVARLNAILNRPADTPLPWPQTEPARPVQVDRGALVAALRERSPLLLAQEFEVERLQSEVGLARRRAYPDIGVGVEWMDMAGPMGSGDAVMVGVQLNLPIWRRSYRAAEMQARAASRRARFERQDLENDLVARLESVLYEFEDSGRKVRLYGDVLVPRSEELIGASETAYMAGTVDFLSLIDAQQNLLDFQLQRERAWANQQQRLAELEMLVGTDLAGRPPLHVKE